MSGGVRVDQSPSQSGAGVASDIFQKYSTMSTAKRQLQHSSKLANKVALP
jgi:hypothetical protein